MPFLIRPGGMSLNMATMGEFTIPSESFPLGSLFTEFPNVTVELERVVPTNRAFVPYVWVRNASPREEKRMEATVCSHADIKDVILVDEVDDEYLLRVEWMPNHFAPRIHHGH